MRHAKLPSQGPWLDTDGNVPVLCDHPRKLKLKSSHSVIEVNAVNAEVPLLSTVFVASSLVTLATNELSALPLEVSGVLRQEEVRFVVTPVVPIRQGLDAP